MEQLPKPCSEEVLVLSQDKGRAIVQEYVDTYESKMLKMLEPEGKEDKDKTYVKLSKDPTKSVKTKITKKLKQLTTRWQENHLYPVQENQTSIGGHP